MLIADDSAVVRSRLSRLLGAVGFDVVAVGDGQQALDLIDAGQVPTVLITDLEMPTVDGFELIAAMRGAIATEHGYADISHTLEIFGTCPACR